MADKKQNAKNNRRRNGSDDDFNPRFRKIRKDGNTAEVVDEYLRVTT